MATVNASFPAQVTSIEAIPLPVSQRFPVPKSAVAGCVNVETEWTLTAGVISPYTINGAVANPESSYLEPTIGQIWPRIG
jgi:hypothetical protein